MLRIIQQLPTPPTQIAMVGDRVFTDVLAGNRLGLFTVLSATECGGIPLSKRSRSTAGTQPGTPSRELLLMKVRVAVSGPASSGIVRCYDGRCDCTSRPQPGGETTTETRLFWLPRCRRSGMSAPGDDQPAHKLGLQAVAAIGQGHLMSLHEKTCRIIRFPSLRCSRRARIWPTAGVTTTPQRPCTSCCSGVCSRW